MSAGDRSLDAVTDQKQTVAPATVPELTAELAALEDPKMRARAIGIGERLEVLKAYPTPPNCTSPFAPVWIAEIVRRQESA